MQRESQIMSGLTFERNCIETSDLLLSTSKAEVN